MTHEEIAVRRQPGPVRHFPQDGVLRSLRADGHGKANASLLLDLAV
jgi:hypothetical protein